jgi:DNA-binding transcriptional regulator/RsmH inhibitor MraZ
MFVGKSLQIIDSEGQVKIPSKMMDVIMIKYDVSDLYLILYPGNTICLYPGEEFKKLIERLYDPKEASLSEPITLQRICAEAEPCRTDGSGRITIPPAMIWTLEKMLALPLDKQLILGHSWCMW